MAGEGYQRRVGPSSPAGLPQADARDFGAGVGAGIEHLGAALEAKNEAARRFRDNEELAGAGVAQQARLAEMDTFLQDARDGKVDGIGPSGTGLQDALLNRFDTGTAEISTRIKSEKVRQRFVEQSANYRRSFANNGFAIEAAKRGAYFSDQHGKTVNLAANRMRGTDDLIDLAGTIADLEDMALSYGLPPEQSSKLVQFGTVAAKRAFLDGQRERNPESVAGLLGSALFNDLDPDMVDQLGREANVEIDKRAREQKAAQEAARKDAQTAIDLLQQKIGTGVPMDDAELEKAQALASAAQLPKEVFNLGTARLQNNDNRVFATAAPEEIDGKIKELMPIAAKGGDAGLVAQVRVDNLNRILAGRSREYANDPWTPAARAGIVMPPLDLADGGSIAARAAAQDKAANRLGRKVPFFSDEETATMAQRYQAGPQGQLGILTEVRNIPDAQRRAAAIRQIAPNDRGLMLAAELPQSVGVGMLNGREALRVNPRLIPAQKADEAFSEHVRGALAGMGGVLPGDVRSIADALYANAVNRNGDTGEFNPTLYWGAVNQALGGDASRQTGGIGQWGGWRVLLPRGMSQDNLNYRLLNEAGLRRAGLKGDFVAFRRQFHPVAVGDGVYEFRPNGQSNARLSIGGEPFRVNIWKVQPYLPPAPVKPRALAPAGYGVR